ncbi:MAG: uroporphyrinogen-III synthase [Woeseia sp.]
MTGKPLAGRVILVTRPEAQSVELSRAIGEAGGSAYAFPVLDIQPRERSVLEQEQATLPPPDIAIFVSSNAVRYGLDFLPPDGLQIAAIGPATRAAIEAAGRTVDICPADGFDSEHLLQEPALLDPRGKTIRIVRADSGRELLGETLRQRGARVDYLSSYRRLPKRMSAAALEAFERRWLSGEIACFTAMSGESLDSFLSILPPGCHDRLPATPLVTPSRRVIQTAGQKIPGVQAILAPGPGAGDMVRAMIMALTA